MIASGFILSVPLFADATYFRLLREEILAGRETELTQRPVDYAPLSFVFEFKGIGRDSPQWNKVVDVDTYLSDKALKAVDLPILKTISDGSARKTIPLFPPLDIGNPKTQYSLTTTGFAFITPMDDSVITILDGGYPKPFVSLLREGDQVEAMAHEDLVVKYGMQVGDTYTVRTDRGRIPVYIIWRWTETDPKAPYWEQDRVNGCWSTMSLMKALSAIPSVTSCEMPHGTS